MHHPNRPSPRRSAPLRWVGALLLSAPAWLACDAPPDVLGIAEATQAALVNEVQVRLALPPEGIPGLPEGGTAPMVAVVPVDLLASLREAGAHEAADLVETHRRKVQRIEVLAIEYEVTEEAGLPVAMDALRIQLAAAGETDPARGFPLGTTLAILPGRSIAMRALAVSPAGLKAASALVAPLVFNVSVSSALTLPPETPVPAGALSIRLRFRLKVHLDLAG